MSGGLPETTRAAIREAARKYTEADAIPKESFPGDKAVHQANLIGYLGCYAVQLLDALEALEADLDECRNTRFEEGCDECETRYEKARDQLDEAADKAPRLEDLASLLKADASAETSWNVAKELDEIADVLGELPERAIGDDSHFDRLEKRAKEAEQALATERSKVVGEKRDLAQAGADAWSAIEEALNSFGEGSHVLAEDGLLIRLRAAQSKLLPCTNALSALNQEAPDE